MIKVFCDFCGNSRHTPKTKYIEIAGEPVYLQFIKAVNFEGQEYHFCDDCFETEFIPALVKRYRND